MTCEGYAQDRYGAIYEISAIAGNDSISSCFLNRTSYVLLILRMC